MQLPGVDSRIRFIRRGWRSANSVLLLGDEPVLIDTGHHERIDETLARIRAQNIMPQSLSLLVNTHSHWDHCGGNQRLRELSGARVAMGPLTAHWMTTGARDMLWLSYFGVDAPLSRPDIILQPDEVYQWGGRPWRAISLPGHAPDTLGFYQPDERVLVCADALMAPGDCGVINVMVHGWEALDAAIDCARRLAELDVRVALPGHGPPIENYPRAVARLQRRLQQFKDEPRWLVTHFARRIVMATVLEIEPTTLQQLNAHLLTLNWPADYAAISGQTAEALIAEAIQALLDGQAMRLQNEQLISQIPK